MKSLRNNKLFYRSLLVSYGCLFCCSLELFPPLNDLLQLAPLPSINDVEEVTIPGALLPLVKAVDFPVLFSGIMALNTLISFVYERLLLDLFENRQRSV